ERAIQHQQAAVEFNPWNPSYRRYLLSRYWELIQSLVRLDPPAKSPRPGGKPASSFRNTWEDYYGPNGALIGCGTQVDKDADLFAVEQKALRQAATDGVRQLLRETFQRGKRKPAHPVEQNNLAWLLATRPEPELRNPARAVELAKKATQAMPREAKYFRTLGVAHYRAGEWRDAVAALRRATELGKVGDSFDFLFLALAHGQLGDKDEARKWYNQAVGWMEKHQPENEELRRLRAEAAKGLGIEKKPD